MEDLHHAMHRNPGVGAVGGGGSRYGQGAMTRTARARHVVDDILAKAGELFDAQGYGETSLQDIADAVGVARPSLYHYFASKEEILVTLVERTIVVRDEIIERVTSTDGDPRERLETLLIEVGRSTSSNPAGLRLVLNAGGALPPEIRRRDVGSRRAMFELLSGVLADGMRAGAFRPADERATAAMVIAALTGLQYHDIGGISVAPDEAARHLAALLLDGLAAGAGGGPATIAEAVANIEDNVRFLEWHARTGEPRSGA
jgi:AcrR family transcriptional regulator